MLTNTESENVSRQTVCADQQSSECPQADKEMVRALLETPEGAVPIMLLPCGLPFSTPAALHLVAEERQRQIAKGFTPEHDARHSSHELVYAAAAYAAPAQLYRLWFNSEFAAGDRMYGSVSWSPCWPWPQLPDKRGALPYRRRLTIAAALLLAEIERLDRAEGTVLPGRAVDDARPCDTEAGVAP